MLNPQDIETLINGVGFPIVAFLLMFWLNVTVVKSNTKAILSLTTMIHKSNNKQTNSIRHVEDNNTYCTPEDTLTQG